MGDQGNLTNGSSPCDFTALFGQYYTDVNAEGERAGESLMGGCDLYRRNQVFPTTELDTVYTALRVEQEKGNLPITMQHLTTVENKEYGVPGGHQVQVLFMFLGRAENFKKLVPKQTQSPTRYERFLTGTDSDTINWGTDGAVWEKGTFPNYDTTNLNISDTPSKLRLISLP